LNFAFSGLPAATTLFVPNVVTNNLSTTAGDLTWTLVSSPGTATAKPITTNVTGTDQTGFTGTSFTIGYELTAQTGAAPTTIDSTDFPFVFAATAGTTLPVGSFGSVAISVGPIDTSSTSTTILRFTTNSTPVTGSLFNVNACVTQLLFPYLTNAAGFNSCVEVANTAADGLGTVGQSGALGIRLWGSTVPTAGASGASITLPVPVGTTTGTAPNFTNISTAGSVAPGEHTVFCVSDVAPGFQGYAILTANFRFAHGFTIVTNGFGAPGSNPVSMGYLPLVLGGSVAARGTGLLAGFPETLAP